MIKKGIALLVVLCFWGGLVSAQIINTFAGDGHAGYSGDGGQATAAELYEPLGLAVDTIGNIYICEEGNNIIRKVNTSGILFTVAGNGVYGFFGDGGIATSAELSRPTGVAVDKKGNIYIADYDDSRIRKVDNVGIISTFAGNGVRSYSGDGGPATAAELSYPYQIFIDTVGNILFADEGNNRIRKIDSLGIISTIAGNGIYGYSGDGGPATAAEFRSPSDMIIDKLGDMYIVDNNNYRVRKVNTSGIISTVVGNGIQGYSGDGGPATAAELHFASQITLDTVGNLYISDFIINRIREVNTSGIIFTMAGNGVGSYSGDGGPATSAELNYPGKVVIDASNNFYIADWGNNRVRIINSSSISTNINDKRENSSSLSIFPNPSTGQFTLSLSNVSESCNVEVYNVFGEEVYSSNYSLSTNHYSLDLSADPNGIYLYRVITENGGLVGEGKVVIQK